MLFFVPLLLLLSPANAAECVSHSGGSGCVSKSELLSYAPDYCNNRFSIVSGNWWNYRDSSGNTGNIGKINSFANAQQCLDAYRDIVNSCHGYKNGGSWTWAGVSMYINFCRW